eukprot:gene9094-biopygen7901
MNGTPVTATQLRTLGEQLLDIHGQHAWQSLTRPESVRGLLDAYANTDPSLTAALWAQWRQDQKAVQQANEAQATLQQERDRLQWQISELDKLAPQPDEWDELESTHKRLSNAHALIEAAQSTIDLLEDEDSGVLAALSRHKRPPSDLPALVKDWKTSLAQLDASSDLAALMAKADASSKAFHAAARALSGQRTKAAPRLSLAITKAMQGLGMQGGKFEVELRKLHEPASHGLDEVSFLVAGHPGMAPKPIGKVASGGELSRISLAIAVTTSQLGKAPTLIFDEVDSGVGGAVAETVGRLMQKLGADRQVLAVTHLPQVAAYAHQHLQGRQALVQIIELERELLADLREQAHVIDTSNIRASQLQSYVKGLLSVAPGGMTLVFQSFAFKRGIPVDADYVFDVRMLPNPHYENALRDLTGLDAPVADFLQQQPDVSTMRQHIEQFLTHWLDVLEQNHRSYVTVAIGCTGGQHRSVYLVEQLAQIFETRWKVLRRHRELDGR